MVQPSPSGRLNMRLDFYLSENSKHWTLLDGQSRLGNLFREDSIRLVYFIFPLKRTFCRPWPCLTKPSPNSKTGIARHCEFIARYPLNLSHIFAKIFIFSNFLFWYFWSGSVLPVVAPSSASAEFYTVGRLECPTFSPGYSCPLSAVAWEKIVVFVCEFLICHVYQRKSK